MWTNPMSSLRPPRSAADLRGADDGGRPLQEPLDAPEPTADSSSASKLNSTWLR